MTLKAVLDTNVLISGVLWRGTPFKILKWAEDQRLAIYSSLDILSEVQRVLNYPKFHKYIDKQQVLPEELLAKITSLCNIVSIDRVVEGAGPDADDDKFLSCAISANVHSLVSGDKHLLDLKMYRSIRILTARAFYEAHLEEMK